MEKNDILVTYGEDILSMTKNILSAAKIEEHIGSTNKRIGLKPNLVVAAKASNGATTHPEIAEGIIQYLQEKGYSNIVIIEGSWVGDRTDRAFQVCGYTDLSEKYGVEIVDTQKDSATAHDCAGMQITICDSALSVDYMINLPVLKGHCQTALTCALKNNKGIITNAEKRRFHSEGLHRPIAHLNVKAKNDFILVDSICGDLNFEEGGNPVQTNRLFATIDPVLCDAYACKLIGYSINEVPYISMASKLGVGECDVTTANVIELHKPIRASKAVASRKAAQLGKVVTENQACSACYAAVIHALERMDDNNRFRSVPQLSIGQGFKGKTGPHGIGNCTNCFTSHVPGCPPNASDVLKYLEIITQ